MRKVAGLAWGLLVFGCGGAQPDVASSRDAPLDDEASRPPAPVSARGSTEARATVGPAGGTLALANGVRLEIPRGAITDPVEVVLGVGAEGYAFGDAERQRPLGPMLNVEPALVAANGEPFVLSMPEVPIPGGFQRDDVAFAIEEVAASRGLGLGTQTRWQLHPVELSAGRMSARVEAFGGHRVQFGVAR